MNLYHNPCHNPCHNPRYDPCYNPCLNSCVNHCVSLCCCEYKYRSHRDCKNYYSIPVINRHLGYVSNKHSHSQPFIPVTWCNDDKLIQDHLNHFIHGHDLHPQSEHHHHHHPQSEHHHHPQSEHHHHPQSEHRHHHHHHPPQPQHHHNHHRYHRLDNRGCGCGK